MPVVRQGGRSTQNGPIGHVSDYEWGRHSVCAELDRLEDRNVCPPSIQREGSRVSHRLSTIEAAVEAIAAGKIVIVMDAEDRENEGDFICAAEKVTPEIVNFMITHGRGQLCMLILPEVAERLDLPPIVREQHGARSRPPSPCRSITSAAARALRRRSGPGPSRRFSTRRASRPTSSGPDTSIRWWRRKGACCGGPDTPSAAVDLARMAGLKPAGVLIEILGLSGDRATPRGTLRPGRAVRPGDHHHRVA